MQVVTLRVFAFLAFDMFLWVLARAPVGVQCGHVDSGSFGVRRMQPTKLRMQSGVVYWTPDCRTLSETLLHLKSYNKINCLNEVSWAVLLLWRLWLLCTQRTFVDVSDKDKDED